MRKEDFYYDLPERLIAQCPAEPRDSSRLMVVKRGEAIEHRVFRDIIKYLNPGDALVINETRVIPARLIGSREGSGGKMELLLLKRLDINRWETLVKPGKRAKTGERFVFGDRLTAVIEGNAPGGGRTVRFIYDGVFEEVLDELGSMPLPPYIHETPDDQKRYQTVYSKTPGSAAAHTAGLHFTPELLSLIAEKGVTIVPVLLHIGLGTFRPVKESDISKHEMHSEEYSLTIESANKLNAVKAAGGRIICVGTTTCRVLETVAADDGSLRESTGSTDIFITPGYRFKAVDALITNFHLPESTLLMLVSALIGREQALDAYENAIAEEYRFFSFGDCMFIC